jgi:hypothetical protein
VNQYQNDRDYCRSVSVALHCNEDVSQAYISSVNQTFAGVVSLMIFAFIQLPSVSFAFFYSHVFLTHLLTAGVPCPALLDLQERMPERHAPHHVPNRRPYQRADHRTPYHCYPNDSLQRGAGARRHHHLLLVRFLLCSCVHSILIFCYHRILIASFLLLVAAITATVVCLKPVYFESVWISTPIWCTQVYCKRRRCANRFQRFDTYTAPVYPTKAMLL